MRGMLVLAVALGVGAPANAEESLTLWLKTADRAQEETICVITRKADGSMTQ
jgi:hypothetical protein